MIRCTECRAPIESSDTECWHCQAELKTHPMRSDLRYWLAYGRLPRYVFNLSACIVLCYIVVSAFELVTGTRVTGNPGTLLCVTIPTLIALLRLIL